MTPEGGSLTKSYFLCTPASKDSDITQIFSCTIISFTSANCLVSAHNLLELEKIYRQLSGTYCTDKETIRKLLLPSVKRADVLDSIFSLFSSEADKVVLKDFFCGLSTICQASEEEKLKCANI